MADCHAIATRPPKRVSPRSPPPFPPPHVSHRAANLPPTIDLSPAELLPTVSPGPGAAASAGKNPPEGAPSATSPPPLLRNKKSRAIWVRVAGLKIIAEPAERGIPSRPHDGQPAPPTPPSSHQTHHPPPPPKPRPPLPPRFFPVPPKRRCFLLCWFYLIYAILIGEFIFKATGANLCFPSKIRHGEDQTGFPGV